jgi:hypothetical protein
MKSSHFSAERSKRNPQFHQIIVYTNIFSSRITKLVSWAASESQPRTFIQGVTETSGQTLVARVPHTETRQQVLGRTKCLLSLIRQGPHWNRRVQQFFYCCVCIRHRGNVSTEPLSSNDRGICTELLPSSDKGIFTEPLPNNDRRNFTEPLPSNDKGICTESLPSSDKGIFTEPLLSYDMADTQTHTHTDNNVIS